AAGPYCRAPACADAPNSHKRHERLTCGSSLMLFTAPSATKYPVYGGLASAAALLLALFVREAWLAPLLIVLLTIVWIIESRTRNAEPVPAAAPGNIEPVREALEDMSGAVVDELGHATRELHQ